jgi:hypothetical protein
MPRSHGAGRIGRLARDENAELLFGVQGRRYACRRAADEDDNAAIGRNIERSPARCAWRAARAVWATARGDLGPARRELEEGVVELAAAPLDANWLYAAHWFGAVAARLGDEAAAAEVYPRLRPYGARIVTGARRVLQWLGALALACWRRR